MGWELFLLVYFTVGALAIRGEKTKVSLTKGAIILVAWLPLLLAVHLGPHDVSYLTSQLVERL